MPPEAAEGGRISLTARVRPELSTPAALLVLLSYATLVGSYFSLRYGGRWIDTDTPHITRAIREVLDQATILPQPTQYATGYGYQALVGALSVMTGLSPEHLQFHLLPVVSIALGIPIAFALFRTIFRSTTMGAIGAWLLYVVPDVLYVTWRGSHEKMTWPLVMGTLLVMFRIVPESSSPLRLRLPLMLAFYLMVFGLISTNVFFAASFIFALLLSAGIYAAVRRVATPDIQLGASLGLLAIILIVMLYLVMFELYPPAHQVFLSTRNWPEKFAAFLLGKTSASSPLVFTAYGWIDRWVYFALNLLLLLLVLVAGVAWLRMARVIPQLPPRYFFAWSLVAAFGAQWVPAVLTDAARISGSNFQLRLTPALIITCVPLALLGIAQVWPRQPWLSRLRTPLAVGAACWFSLAALLKASNEPMLSNYWIFYHDNEAQALRWIADSGGLQKVWLEIDAVRLSGVWRLNEHDHSKVLTDGQSVDPDVSDYLISSTTQRWTQRNQAMMPDVTREHMVYDNGDTQLFHRRPRTAFQR